MKLQSELSALKKAAGCAVIFLGMFGAATGLSVAAHADGGDGGDGGGIYWDGEFILGGDVEGGLVEEGDGIASLDEATDDCGESTEESRC